jgi:2-keto-4-pentenoate hydratase/2-oxohepta-3-ene-1,7-dioic acid hydratase in catechol pathway
MKLVSFSLPSPMGPQIRTGALDAAGGIVDLAGAFRGALLREGLTPGAAARVSEALLPGDMVALIEGGDRSLDAARRALQWAAEEGLDAGPNAGPDAAGVPIVYQAQGLHFLPPVPRPPLLRDFMGFETHLRNIYPKLGREIPPEWYKIPVYYKGNPGSLGTHGDDIPIPSYATALDIEFELAMVIGRGGINIPPERALDHVFGYMIYNDFSERTIQAREMSVGLGPAKGKDFVRGHVLGPYLVTADEVPDVYNLRMVARVNDEVWCESHSGTIHWKFEQMIAHVSTDEYLWPGEVLGSGTVGGGSGTERGTLLGRGDVVELEVERLGTLKNRVI